MQESEQRQAEPFDVRGGERWKAPGGSWDLWPRRATGSVASSLWKAAGMPDSSTLG